MLDTSELTKKYNEVEICKKELLELNNLYNNKQIDVEYKVVSENLESRLNEKLDLFWDELKKHIGLLNTKDGAQDWKELNKNEQVSHKKKLAVYVQKCVAAESFFFNDPDRPSADRINYYHSLTKAWIKACNLDFSKQDLKGLDFSNLNLMHANFQDSDLSGCNFRNSKLVNANLSNTKLYDTYMLDCNLNGANLKDSNMKRIYLTNASLVKTNLENCRITDASLHNANMALAILVNTDLKRTDMTRANLANASIQDTCLEETILDSTNFSGARIKNINTKGAKFIEVKGLDTKAPSGLKAVGKDYGLDGPE